MPARLYPDYRTPNERERDRKRAAAEQKKADAEAAAARRAELDRLERLKAAGTHTPQTHPEAFRQIVLDVHVEHLAPDLTVMSRVMRRIVRERAAAMANGDAAAHRDATEEGELLTLFMRQYLLMQMHEEEQQGGSGQYEQTRAFVGKAAQSLALRRLREAS